MTYTYHGIEVESGIELDSCLFVPKGAETPTQGSDKTQTAQTDKVKKTQRRKQS